MTNQMSVQELGFGRCRRCNRPPDDFLFTKYFFWVLCTRCRTAWCTMSCNYGWTRSLGELCEFKSALGEWNVGDEERYACMIAAGGVRAFAKAMDLPGGKGTGNLYFWTADGTPIHVRTTLFQGAPLILRADKDDHGIYVLVLARGQSDFELIGWTRGNEARKIELKSIRNTPPCHAVELKDLEAMKRWEDPVKQVAAESEGLEYNEVLGVYDEDARLVNDFEPTLNELEVLANYYFEKANSIEFEYRIDGCVGNYVAGMSIFAPRRLATLENVLGGGRFQRAIARTKGKWNKIFADAEEIEENLEPCKTCGRERTYRNYVFYPDGSCSICQAIKDGLDPSDIPDETPKCFPRCREVPTTACFDCDAIVPVSETWESTRDGRALCDSCFQEAEAAGRAKRPRREGR